MRSTVLRSTFVPTARVLAAAAALAGCDGPAMPAPDAMPPDAGPPIHLDLVADLADPYAPARLRIGAPFLVSSREPEAPEGMLNRDHTYYVREEDGRGVMIDRVGPGVVTRWWMTIGNLPGVRDPEAVRVFLWVDGVEVDPDGGEHGITLGELTSGRHAGLAAPFTLGREGTSGGFVVSQPIHYQRSFRADVTLNAGWTYYQLEGTDYPANVVAPTFTHPPSEEALASLESAATLWRDHEHPGIDREGDSVTLAAGESTELSWAGPGVATTLVLEVPRAARDAVRLVVEGDGERAIDAPLAWLAGGVSPAATAHASALFVVDDAAVRLHHPMPFEEGLTVRLESGAAGEVPVRIGGRVVSGALDADLGRLRTDCGTHGPVASIAMCGTTDASLRAPNNVVASWSGGRGHYVGHSLVQDVASDWWCALEPDHEIWIDGRYALLGTGMEDYYSAGFYFMNGPVQWLLAGATAWDRDEETGAGSTHVYRHHLVDTIPFESELRFELESYVDETTFTGCAFFYVAPD